MCNARLCPLRPVSEVSYLDLDLDLIACTRLDEFHDWDIALHFLAGNGIPCHGYLSQTMIETLWRRTSLTASVQASRIEEIIRVVCSRVCFVEIAQAAKPKPRRSMVNHRVGSGQMPDKRCWMKRTQQRGNKGNKGLEP